MTVTEPYVVRFRRARPVLTIAVSAISLVMSSVWFAEALHDGHPSHALPPAALAVAAIALATQGIGRLIRGRHRGWIAFAVDADGIYFGAQPRAEARRFGWDEVSALVLFSRRTEFVHGAVECVGVRLHPATPGSPEHHLSRLDRELSKPSRELHLWEQLRTLTAGPSSPHLETAVSFHAEARGWGCRRPRLRRTMRAHAPGVPVLEFTADSYHDLVGWRADQDRLHDILDEG